MRASTVACLTLLSATLTGCQESGVAPVVSTAVGDGIAANSGSAETRVVGSGHVPVGMTEDLREFTFHAVRHPDGSVSGSYKIERTDTGIFFVVDVTCLAVEGNTGWIGGIISESNTASIRVGTISYFWARDNGEGANAPADVVSLARVNDRAGEDLAFCALRPLLLPSLTVQSGNVQVQ